MSQHRSTRSWILIVTLFVLGASVISCGTDDSGPASAQNIFDPGQTVTLADLQAMGFKKSKEYDVEGLAGADGAYFGFWGLDPYDREDYEVRFFSSHSDAIELGIAQANERIGEDAILDEESSSWPVGLKDARQCAGDKGSGPASHGIQNCASPKYWHYSIYANMILLCSGGTVDNARASCSELLANLAPQTG